MQRTHVKTRTSFRNDLLGILTEVLFAGGMILVALFISWLFFLGR